MTGGSEGPGRPDGRMVSMLPIEGNFTSDLLEGMNDEFIEWMMEHLRSGKSDESKQVLKALKDADQFRATMNAGIQAMMCMPGGVEKGAAHLVTLCLLMGWKLAERRMEQLAGANAT